MRTEMSKDTLRVMSLFSGIGAFEKALQRSKIPHEIVGWAENDKYAIESYKAIYGVDDSLNIGDITKANKADFPDFDLLVGGSPCQAFSVCGKKLGFQDTRGTLFYEFAATLEAKKPKYFIYENVKGLINHDKGNTFDIIIRVLSELGYTLDYEILDSKFYDVPQQRERIFLIGIYQHPTEAWTYQEGATIVPKSKKRLMKKIPDLRTFNFSFPQNKTVTKRIQDILEEQVDEKYYIKHERVAKFLEDVNVMNYLQDKCKGFVISHDTLIERKDDIATCVDANYWKGLDNHAQRTGVIEFYEDIRYVGMLDRQERFKDVYGVLDPNGQCPTLTTMQGGGREPKIFEDYHFKIRKLTPKEVWRLQAFDDQDIEKAIEAGISNSQLYKQAGNSITVSVLEALYKKLFEYTNFFSFNK